MTELSGRRAANHAATHEAILDAAGRLFAEQGFEATSIRQIAKEAGVGERTFYRYFDGKEALLADEVDTWLGELTEAITAQPPSTPSLTAARVALCELLSDGDGSGATTEWLLRSQPRPLELLRRSAPRPLRRVEQTIADALAARGAASSAECDLAARVSVAVVRSAVTRVRTGEDDATSISGLVDDGFDALAGLVAGTAGAEPAAQELPRRRARRSRTATAISVAAERMRSSG